VDAATAKATAALDAATGAQSGSRTLIGNDHEGIARVAGPGLGEAERLAWYRARLPSKGTSGEEYRRRQADLRALLADPGTSVGIEGVHPGPPRAA